jgi:hypothetical protein
MVIFADDQDDINGGLVAPPAVVDASKFCYFSTAAVFPAFGNTGTIRQWFKPAGKSVA